MGVWPGWVQALLNALCSCAHARVCLVFLDYILAYCLVSGSAYLAGLLHSLDLCFCALYHTLISS